MAVTIPLRYSGVLFFPTKNAMDRHITEGIDMYQSNAESLTPLQQNFQVRSESIAPGAAGRQVHTFPQLPETEREAGERNIG